MQIDWSSIRSGQAHALHDRVVDLSGWMIPLEPGPLRRLFLAGGQRSVLSRLRAKRSAVEHRSYRCLTDPSARRTGDDSQTPAPSD